MSRLFKRIIFCVSVLWFFMGFFSNEVDAFETNDAFLDYCMKDYEKDKTCPDKLCRLVCVPEKGEEDCSMQCRPKECPFLDFKDCPLSFCSVMMSCSGEPICHYKMVGRTPACGDLSYGGQDVDCCPGLVRRCGVEFLDKTCDMEGKHSVYNIPICIPCGNDICEQFEDSCNCPEDCGSGEYSGHVFIKDALEKAQELKRKQETKSERSRKD